MTEGGLFIGKVAERAGMNPRTIRYYEAIDLLTKPQRGHNRYRIYSADAVEMLRFIRKAQSLGFTLSEIREIVQLRRMGSEPCVHVCTLLRRKIADLDQRLSDLVTLRKKLKNLLARSEERTKAKRGKMNAVVCPHIENVSSDPRPRA